MLISDVIGEAKKILYLIGLLKIPFQDATC